MLKDTVYHNYSYKPTGIYPSSKAYKASVKNRHLTYVEVYPNLVTHLSISEELYQACSDYLKPHLSTTTTYLVVEIAKGRVHTDNATSVAVISEDNKLIADVSFSYDDGKTVAAEENNIFQQRYFTKPKKYPGTVFTLLTGGSGTSNYFHWLIDVLPRIHLLKKSGMFEQVDWFLVPAYRYDFQKQSLQMLGIREDKIIEGDKHAHIEADRLIASSAPRGTTTIIPYWLCDFLRSAFLQEATLGKPSAALIYISRKDSKFRNVSNEAALTALLDKYGFKTFVLSQLSFIEQVNLFASAQVVIAPHGAGLINLVLCKTKTKVIEIFAGGYVKASYHDLSGKVDLDYNYLICKRSPKVNNIKKGMKLNIYIEQEEVNKTLIKILDKFSVSTLGA